MSTLDLDQLLDTTLGSQDDRERPWRKFGLLQNPFPSSSCPIWDVLYNQKEVVDRFHRKLKEFLQQGNNVTMFFTGGNRVGKTHFMEHHRRALLAKFEGRGVAAPIALVSAQSCDFWQIYRQIVDQVDETLRRQTGHGFFHGALPESVKRRLDTLPPGDFRRAAEKYARTDAARLDWMGSLFRQWLACGRLRVNHRNDLGVGENIDSIAHVLNTIESFIKYLLLWDGTDKDQPFRCPGVIVFVDEFELVWNYRRDRRDQFLQSLRALIDACPRGLFLCIGMATLGVTTLEVEASYPALFQRLKGADAVPTLVQISSVVDALGYAKAFLDHGRQEAAKQGVPSESAPFLSDADIEALFKKALRGGSASQGDFFDALHSAAERRAAGEPAVVTGKGAGTK